MLLPNHTYASHHLCFSLVKLSSSWTITADKLLGLNEKIYCESSVLNSNFSKNTTTHYQTHRSDIYMRLCWVKIFQALLKLLQFVSPFTPLLLRPITWLVRESNQQRFDHQTGTHITTSNQIWLLLFFLHRIFIFIFYFCWIFSFSLFYFFFINLYFSLFFFIESYSTSSASWCNTTRYNRGCSAASFL